MTPEAAIRLMVEHKIRRFKTADLEIELADEAFRAPTRVVEVEGAPPAVAMEVCPCGHDMTEHNDTGCLKGCDIAKCLTPEARTAMTGAAT